MNAKSETLLQTVLNWAREDEESPRRAAVYFMCEDAAFAGSFSAETWTAIDRDVHAMTDDDCVAICKAHGALRD